MEQHEFLRIHIVDHKSTTSFEMKCSSRSSIFFGNMTEGLVLWYYLGKISEQ